MYCVPDSLALALKQDKEVIRKRLFVLLGHDPALVYGDEHLRVMHHITGRTPKAVLLPAIGKAVRLKDIIVREFKRGPYLVGFYVGYNRYHVVYVDGGMIYCNHAGPTWYADYKWERARVRQIIRP